MLNLVPNKDGVIKEIYRVLKSKIPQVTSAVWLRQLLPVETHGVNPKAIQIMKEDGIDISGHTSNNVNEYRDLAFDYVITVCDNAKERCPVFPSTAQQFHYNFPDPAKAMGTEEEVLQQFREVRNMIKNYSREFVSRNL